MSAMSSLSTLLQTVISKSADIRTIALSTFSGSDFITGSTYILFAYNVNIRAPFENLL